MRRVLFNRICYQLSTSAKSSHDATSAVTAEAKEVRSFESIPSPPRVPVIGHLHLFSKFGPYSFEGLQDAFLDLHKKYGDIVRLDLGIQMVLLFRPELAQRLYALEVRQPKRPVFEALQYYRRKKKDVYSCAGLVTENGEEWERLRNATNFMLTPGFAKTYFKCHEEIAQDFVSRILRKRNTEGRIPDFLKEIYRYTEEAIGIVCFGIRLGLLEDGEMSSRLTQAAEDTLQSLADTLLGFPWWKIFNTRAYKKLVRSQDFLQRFSSDCAQKAALKLQDPNHDNDPELGFIRIIFENKNLSQADVTLLMTEMFSAGIDATGNIIGYLLYNLSQRPDAQQKLYQEIKDNKGQQLSPGSIESMKFLLSCIKETYRLTPTSGGNARILSAPAVISGYQLPAGVLCIAQNPIMSRSDKYFTRPNEFLPERWYEGKSSRLQKAKHPYCILPFSFGTRSCVGRRFAEQEIQLATIKIIEKFEVRYHGPPIRSINRLSLIPDKPLNFTFIER